MLTAAGNSVRFGSDKLMRVVSGAPMIERALSLLSDIELCFRVVVTQPNKERIVGMAGEYGFCVAFNDRPQLGMSESVKIGVAEVLKNCSPDGILFCVADQPYLKRKSAVELIECFKKNPCSIVRLAANGRVGNPVIFPQDTFSGFFEIEGDIGGSAVIAKHREKMIVCDVAKPIELCDIDTEQEDYDVRT